ncbi:TPA: hypothetical protein ACX6RX_003233 [Photobacterium damselae]
MTEKLIRFSTTQRLALKILMDHQENVGGIKSAMDLYDDVCRELMYPPTKANYRISMHTLIKRGFVDLFRHPKSLKMAYQITDDGLIKALEFISRDIE